MKHTIVPWNVEGATYATNYAGPNPYDVSYQTSTDLTGLGTKGVLEVLNTNEWLLSPVYRSTNAKFIPNTLKKSMYKGKLYGLPVHHRRHGRLLQQGSPRQGGCEGHPAASFPALAAAGKRSSRRAARERLGLTGAADGQGLHVVLPLRLHAQPRRRHHLEGPVAGDLRARRDAGVALQFYSDLVN